MGINFKGRRSPLREGLLRQAGQSTDERYQDLWDEILQYLTLAFFMVGFALFGFLPRPSSPWIIASMALVACAFCIRKLLSLFREMKDYRLGRDGEKTVAQHLDVLRENGTKILHDLPGDGFNIDHVLVCPKGIFTIETKTVRKPRGEDPKMAYNGQKLTINGIPLPDDPLPPARGQTRWLVDLLRKETGRAFAVTPVVVFPGWWIEKKHNGAEVWVLNDKALPAFLAGAPDKLSPEDVALVYSRLSDRDRIPNREE